MFNYNRKVFLFSKYIFVNLKKKSIAQFKN